QEPWLARLFNGKILLRAVTRPLAGKNIGTEPAGNLGSPVVAHRVNHDPFGRPADARKATLDVGLLISCNDDDRNRDGQRAAAPSTARAALRAQLGATPAMR